MKRIDHTGKTFGRLTVVRYAETRKSKAWWICRCSCGTVGEFRGEDMVSGQQKSCGCLRNEISGGRTRTHGRSKSPEYHVWVGMIARCEKKNIKGYDRYGGRGISVCDRWRHSFANFLADMGNRPSERHSIERVNNDGNYEPGNCRWATTAEQSNNTRRTIRIVIGGREQSLKSWCKELGKSYSSTQKRIYAGVDPSMALLMDAPPRPTKAAAPCSSCGIPTKPTRKGLCNRCYKRSRAKQVEANS